MSSEYIPLEILTDILRRLPLIALLRFRSVSKTWKRVIDSPCFRSFHKAFISPPTTIVSYKWCDKHIPVEIQSEILKRLPLKSILRFRSVSKSWKFLIDSPFFIAFYGVRHPQLHRFILSYECRKYPHQYSGFGFVEDADHVLRHSIVPAVPYNTLRDGYPHIVGSSHGLLCLYKRKWLLRSDVTERVVLWNPSIRKSVCIQLPCMYDFPDDKVVGFGVCPVTFDPTILKIECLNNKSKTKDWRVGVFTLRTGTWSFLSTGLPRESITLIGSQVVIHRFIYWAAYEYMLDAEDGQDRLHSLIMSFDLTTKDFKEINLPDSLSHWCFRIHSISKLHDSLVLLGYHKKFKGDPSYCCVWMMTKKQGVNISFTKLYNINVPCSVKKLLGFKMTGELILVTKQGDQGQLKLYHPITKAISNLDIRGEDYSFFMCSYMESMLLLDQLDGCMYAFSYYSQINGSK